MASMSPTSFGTNVPMCGSASIDVEGIRRASSWSGTLMLARAPRKLAVGASAALRNVEIDCVALGPGTTVPDTRLPMFQWPCVQRWRLLLDRWYMIKHFFHHDRWGE